MNSLKFVNVNQSLFLQTTRQRVDQYFKVHAISKYGNRAMWCKALFFLGGFLASYLLILSNHFGAWTMAALAALLGAFSAFIGFNICHDAMHGAFSENRHVNRAFSILFHLIGANPYLWNISHNLIHHTFSNIPGHDEDIDIAPGLIRLSEDEKVNRLQRYQHVYAFLLYGLATLNWVFRKDYLKFFKKRTGQYSKLRHPPKEYFNLFLFKGVYYFLFIILPLLVLHISVGQFIAGFIIMHLVQGFLSGLVFQLAHVVQGTAFPNPNDQGNIEEEWAVHQMRTTANFAQRSAWVNFFYGGLNFQIEHHLFPKICHIHYPRIAGIVRDTAVEFNLPYIENPTFFSALHSHYKMLKKLGKEAYEEQITAGA